MLTEEEIKAMQEENATLKGSVESLTTSTTSMQAKMDQLLTETKTAKGAAKLAAEDAQKILDEKALADNNFEQLYKSSESRNEKLMSDFNGLREDISTKDRSSLANKIANVLAEGQNAELLSTFIAPRLKSTDDGIRILDANGALTVLTPEDLAAEFKTSDRYASLLKGNQSSGGGANGGNKNGGAVVKTMNRASFDGLNPIEKMGFIKSGGKTTDE
jgi:hypothetical protein